MRTYLTVWHNSESASQTVVAEKLQGMGFKPIKGRYDHLYDWGRKIELEEILQMGNAVHDTLKGLKVLYKLETV